jgi:multiple sugar transport system ATP-binding protein
MTVRENMGFALRLAKTPDEEINKKVSEAARILDLEQHLDRKPANLSGGQRQRVAMGRAIVRNPSAFLMDEPLSNLDAKLRVQMRAEISRIQQRFETTTIYVTHDQTEALTLGDRIAVMRAGILQQVGEPGELYNRPKNLFVAGFIGSPSMNFLPGQIDGDMVRLPIGDLKIPDSLRSRLSSGPGGGRNGVIVGLRPEPSSFRTAPAASPSPPRSTCSSRWARSSTPTSTSSPRRSPRESWKSWPTTPGPPTCRVRREARSWPVWRPPAGRGKGRRPSCGSTPSTCTSSILRTARACSGQTATVMAGGRRMHRPQSWPTRTHRHSSPTPRLTVDQGGVLGR